MNIFTIDGGTTNTRIAWVCDGTVKEQIKIPCGAGRTAETGSNAELCRIIGEGIKKLSEKCEVREVVVSGMCNSELGICEVPHITAPADIKTLAGSVKTLHIPQVSNHLFRLIPGMKCGMASLESADMMRGEETEFFGLCKSAGVSGAVLAVLPGTHTKLVRSDSDGQIVSCITTISGEMIKALSENTILKNSLTLPFDRNFDSDALKNGYLFAKTYGLNRALFKVRIMQTQMNAEATKINSFFTGAVLCADIVTITEEAKDARVIIGGSEPLNLMFAELISLETGKSPDIAKKEDAETASAIGAYEIFKEIKMGQC
ncbi:MAG: 2-dehydro-3-deoxygalactonokinase [Clostridia bacterium]|nr:2-dehydro-3-deoxygalactonokinase [Clostridia bacterium]